MPQFANLNDSKLKKQNKKLITVMFYYYLLRSFQLVLQVLYSQEDWKPREGLLLLYSIDTAQQTTHLS